MGDIDQKNMKQVDFLLADFNSIKAEIGRRSNLQRFVLALYVGIVAFVFQQSTSIFKESRWIIAVWWSAALVFHFYIREAIEIGRLSRLISMKIMPIVKDILDVPIEKLTPSETNSSDNKYDPYTRGYDVLFNVVVFFVVPMIFSQLLNYSSFLNTSSILISLPAIGWTIYLLYWHTIKKNPNGG